MADRSEDRPFGPATVAIHGGGGAGIADAIEQRVALLEDGAAAVAVASGSPLIVAVFQPLLAPGGEVIVARQCASGAQLGAIAPGFGWVLRLADVDDPAAFARAVTPRTQAILVDSVAASGEVADIAEIAAVAKRAQVPLIVDNTPPTPVLCRPFDFGASIVLHADTRSLSGEACGIGFIVDSGRFHWMATQRYPALTEKRGDGVALAEAAGNFAYASACRAFAGAARAADARLAAGLETLPLRMAQHAASARAVAEFLAGDARVVAVRHAPLPGDRHHTLAEQYCPGGVGALVVVVVNDGDAGATRLMDRVELIGVEASSRAARSSVTRAGGGVPGEMRLWVGLEDVADIIADLDRALADD